MGRISIIILLLLSPNAEAAPKWNRLSAPSASASSYLQNNWNRFTENYHPSYALDGDPKTAWVEGAEGDGLGEWLEWPISTLANARSIKVRIRSGYFKSKPLFSANAAPKEVRLEVRDTGGAVVAEAKVDLARKMEWQEIVVDTSKGRDLGAIRLAVVSAHPGKQYKDTCISDVETYADSDVAYKAEVEKGKQKALSAWIGERKKQAAYFAKLPKTYPFTATHFDVSTTDGVEGGWDEAEKARPDFVPLAKQLSTKLSPKLASVIDSEFRAQISEIDLREKDGGAAVAPGLWRVAFARRVPLPDGFEELRYNRALPFLAGFFDPENVTFFEASSGAEIDLRKTGSAVEQELTRKWTISNIRVAWADAAKKIPQRIYFKETVVVEERSVYEATAHQLITCDARGRPQSVISKEVSNDGQLSYVWYRFTSDSSGRTDQIEVKRAAYYREFEEEPGTNSFGTALAKAK